METKPLEVYDDGMLSYIKKPIIIQAKQLIEPIIIDTLEGKMRGNSGDYLVKGIRGEYYPVRRDIFEETYQLVDCTVVI